MRKSTVIATDYNNNQLSPSAASEHESMEQYLYASF